jgi:hypothetical protein
MADGTTKAIEDVEVGDWVWAEDPETGERGPRQVTEVILGLGPKELVEISVCGSNGSVTATDVHPFWEVSTGTWVHAQDLKVGDQLWTTAGYTVYVSQVHADSVPFQAVYNLTIDGLHTYYVLIGDQPVLVHNARCQVRRRIANDELQGPPPSPGRPPIGSDGHPVELHHRGQRPNTADEMTRTDHRLGDNYRQNHSNTGQEASAIDRSEFNRQRREYWEAEWNRGRFDELLE